MKPTVVVMVRGGIAEYQVFPPDAAVNVEVIDFDNLDDGGEDPPVKDVEQLVKTVKALPDNPALAKKTLLVDLQRALARVRANAKRR
jgi:hypothetical protein